MSGEGLDREAVRRRATAAGAGSRHYAADVPALLDALEAAEAKLAESVPQSALAQVGWQGPYGTVPGGLDNDPARHWRPVYVLRTEGGAS